MDGDLDLPDKASCQEGFARLTSLLRNLNYAPAGSSQWQRYRHDLDALLAGMTRAR